MHPNFLVITEVAQEGFVTKLADQAFSIVLLVLIAVLLWRRIRQMEDKLEKYMNEDREEMKEVISNNTRAFDRIAAKLTCIVLFFAIGFSACATRKITTEVTRTDTARIELAEIKTAAYAYHEKVTRDTVITIAPRLIRDTLDHADLSPLVNIQGQKVANTHRARSDGITSTVTVLPGGGVAVECQADELTLQVRSLTYQRDSLGALVDSQRSAMFSATLRSNIEKETIKTGFKYQVIGWIIILAFVGLIVYATRSIWKRF